MATTNLSESVSPNKQVRVALYGRVSTSNHGQDVSMQTRELEQFAQARGWRLVDSYLDIGISGTKDKRPELDRLMADAHKRRFDVLVVWRFDRFPGPSRTCCVRWRRSTPSASRSSVSANKWTRLRPPER